MMKRRNKDVGIIAQNIISSSNNDIINKILKEEMTSNLAKNVTRNFLASITIGPVSYEFWKSENKIKMMKTVIPGSKIADKDEIKTLEKNEAFEELDKIAKKIKKNF